MPSTTLKPPLTIEVAGSTFRGSDDVFRSTRTPASAVILDTLLFFLTHKVSLVRRLSYLVFVASIVGSVCLLNAVDRSFKPVLHEASVAHADRDEAAFNPAPWSTQQQNEYERLSSLINSRVSQFDPRFSNVQGTSKYVPITAVLVHDRRPKAIQLVVKQLTRHPFVKEILIWNNRPGSVLTERNFTSIPPTVELRIFNSPSNVHDAAKYIACSLASYDHCYFNDDRWLNRNLDALYTRYVEAPASIVSSVTPAEYEQHRRWQFYNGERGLHAGFTGLSAAFAPKAFATTFLRQQSALPSALSPEQSLHADLFFALWTNTYPQEMPVPLIPLDIDGPVAPVDRDAARIAEGIQTAVYTLFESLADGDVADLFSGRSSVHEPHTRAPCHDDTCLFLTSVDAFPSPQGLAFKLIAHRSFPFMSPQYELVSDTDTTPPRIGSYYSYLLPAFGATDADDETGDSGLLNDFNPHYVPSLAHYEAMWDPSWPKATWFAEQGAYHLAVDGRGIQTCWEARRPFLNRDYFGIVFVHSRKIHHITIVGSRDLADLAGGDMVTDVDNTWVVRTESIDATRTVIQHSIQRGFMRTLTSNRIEVSFSIILENDMPVKKLLIVSKGAKRFKTSVCSFKIDGWEV